MSDRLRKAREVTGMDQSEFGDRVGISRTSISAYESGRISQPRRIVLNAWAMATGVPLQWIMTGVAPKNDNDPASEEAGSDWLLRLDSNQQPSD